MVCLCAVDHLTNWNVACRVACAGTAEENELPLAGSDPLRRVECHHARFLFLGNCTVQNRLRLAHHSSDVGDCTV